MISAAASSRASSSFEDYIQENHRVWRRFPVAPLPPDRPSIAIDLLTDHPAYVIGNCVIGKYLQHHFGWRPVALIRSAGNSRTRRIAESFHIPTIVTYNETAAINVQQDLRDLFKNQSLAEQRTTLINLTFNDVPIGDLIYDNFLRSTGNGTIDQIDEQTLHNTYCGLKDFINADKIIKKYNIHASVQGHIVYAQYGTLARQVVHRGGEVFARKAAGGPFTLRRYRDLASLRDYEFVFSQREYAAIWDTRRAEAISTARTFMQQRMAQATTTVSHDGVEAYRHDKRIYLKSELLNLLGLDLNKPTVCIMSHVFSDAPHTFSHSLYDDYVLWLRATLELIETMPHTNWLIKPHPDNCHYQPKHDTETEAAAYIERCAHIALVPADCNTASLFDMVDGVVTVCGTAGLEFPCWGIPSLNAGKSFYTGFGFTNEPQTQEDYAYALQHLGRQGRLSSEKIERALVAAYLYYFASRVTCRYVPDVPDVFWLQRNLDDIWHEARDAASTGSFWDDPLYLALAKQLHDGADHVFALQPAAD